MRFTSTEYIIDVVLLKVELPIDVREVFNKLFEKCAQDLTIVDLLSRFELGLPKKKKGFELCILIVCLRWHILFDTEAINPINVALNVTSTVTSMVAAGFATRRKVRLVLDESKPLSFYGMDCIYMF